MKSMMVHLTKPFDDETKSSSFRRYTVRKVKAGVRVRHTTLHNVLGTSTTVAVFRDSPTWLTATEWMNECVKEDRANGWITK